MNNHEQILQSLQHIEELLQTLLKPQIAPILDRELTDPKMKSLYALTGSRTVNDLAKQTGFSTGKISGIWKHWEQLGLLIKEGRSYRKVLR